MRGVVTLILGASCLMAASLGTIAQVPSPYAGLLRAEVARSAKRVLGANFELPQRDHTLKLTRTLVADVDADGDLDALAATRGGGVVVWINVGGNRLERRAPRTPVPGDSVGVVRRGASLAQPGTLETGRFLEVPRLAGLPEPPARRLARAENGRTIPRAGTGRPGTRGPPLLHT